VRYKYTPNYVAYIYEVHGSSREEAIEIRLNSSNFNRDEGFSLSTNQPTNQSSGFITLFIKAVHLKISLYFVRCDKPNLIILFQQF
jgi:hypothetical protein